MIVAAEPHTDQAKNNGQTNQGSAAPDADKAETPTRGSAAPDADRAETAARGSAAPDAERADSAAGSLDSLLVGGTEGPVSRFRPDASLARWGFRLATQPGTLARQALKLSADLTSIALGSSELAPARRDRRFADPAWAGNPLLKRTLQTYLALGGTAEDLLADADLDWRDNTRLQFLLTNFIAASAPSNNPALNPAAWKAFIDSGGLSLLRGLRAFTSDMSSSPRIPTMVRPDAFTIGKDLAVTPGSVVLRTEVLELIQYKPSTPTVHQFPLLMVPPMINKYYITDLAPGRSMLEFFVSQGHQVFVISWRNPDAHARHWDINTFGAAIVDAMRIAREITKAPKLNVIALCAGGIMTSMVSAHLSAIGQLDQLSSLGLGVTLLDMTEAGTTVSLMNEGTAAGSILASRVRGYMDGRSLAEVFAWLRPDDLIWGYWVNNYLEGKSPPPFDILYWNADTTRMPAALHKNFIEIAMANALTKPGAVSMLGSPVDLSKIDVPSYVVAGIDDHISPWPSAYRATQLLGSSDIKFVLSNSGHIAAMVNPPTNPKATYRVGAGHPPDHKDWLAKAETAQGSWWPDYTAWLESRSGETKQAPKTLGSAKYPPLDPAPGTYILQR
jgi:polyhydroxyalkanoate synthase subunit PhaC